MGSNPTIFSQSSRYLPSSRSADNDCSDQCEMDDIDLEQSLCSTRLSLALKAISDEKNTDDLHPRDLLIKNVKENQNDYESVYWLGYCYKFGIDGDKDIIEADKLYKKAKRLKSMHELKRAQLLIYRDKNYSQALEILKNITKEDEDFAPVWFELGKCCEFGYGVKENIDKAVDYYGGALNLGHAEAGYRRYLLTDEMECLQESAQLDYPDALNMLGVFYWNGCGVEKNIEKATVCFLNAAFMGHPDAIYSLGYFYQSKPKELHFNEIVVSRFLKKLYRLKQNNFSMSVKELKNETQLINSSVSNKQYFDAYAIADLFELASQLGHVASKLELAKCYLHGEGRVKNSLYGIRLLESAKSLGNLDAQNILNDYSLNQSNVGPVKLSL